MRDRIGHRGLDDFGPHRNHRHHPLAFGLLFGTGLYAIYQKRGSAFVKDYMNLLSSTGEANAADLAARFGIDIRKKAFWQDRLKIIEERVERYCKIK